MAVSSVLKTRLRARGIEAAADFAALRNQVDILTLPRQSSSRYLIGFAASDDCIEQALRLRYEVFNLELEEGLSSSHLSGLDRDDYDDQMTHLVLIDRATERIVGTYRLQTVRQGLAARGLYSAQEFDLSDLAPYHGGAVECGRACIAVEHRSLAAILQLWAGIRGFINMHRHRWLFGCCSLTSRDPRDGWRALRRIRADGYLHPGLMVPTRADFDCGDPGLEHDPRLCGAIDLPKLFHAYMRLGARVISGPAIDHAFGTIDFLVMMDACEVSMSSLEVDR